MFSLVNFRTICGVTLISLAVIAILSVQLNVRSILPPIAMMMTGRILPSTVNGSKVMETVGSTSAIGKTEQGTTATKTEIKQDGTLKTTETTETTADETTATEETTIAKEETTTKDPTILNWLTINRDLWPSQRNFDRPSYGALQINHLEGAPPTKWRPTGHTKCCSNNITKRITSHPYNTVKTNGTAVAQFYDVVFDPRFQQIVIFGKTQAVDKKPNETLHDLRCELYDSSGGLIATGEKVTLFSGGYVTESVMRCPWLNRTAIMPSYFALKLGEANAEQVVQVKWAGLDQLAICLGVFFGYQDWLLLLQFFEYYLREGVSKFYVATNQLTTEGRVIVDYYKRLGYVDETEWPNKELCESAVTSTNCLVPWLNQCEERTGQLYTYTLVLDMDEFLYTDNMTLIEFVLRNDRADVGSIVFRPRWFARHELSAPANAKMMNDINVFGGEIPMRKYENATHYPYRGHTIKTIAKSAEVSLRWIHYVQEYAVPAKMQNVDVDPEIGYIRHFRNYTTWGENYIKEADSFGNHSILPMESERLARLTAGMHSALREIFGYTAAEVV